MIKVLARTLVVVALGTASAAAQNPWATPAPTPPTPTPPTQQPPAPPAQPTQPTTPAQPTTPSTPAQPTPASPIIPATPFGQPLPPAEPATPEPPATPAPAPATTPAPAVQTAGSETAVTATADVEDAAPPALWSVGAEINLDVPRGNLEDLVRTSKGLRLTGQYKVLPMLAIVGVFDFIPLLNQPSVSSDVSMNYFALHAGARLGIPNPTGWSVFGTAALGYQHLSSDLMDANGLGLLIGASAEYALPKQLTASLSLSFSNSTGNTDAEDIEVSFWTFGAGVARAF